MNPFLELWIEKGHNTASGVVIQDPYRRKLVVATLDLEIMEITFFLEEKDSASTLADHFENLATEIRAALQQ